MEDPLPPRVPGSETRPTKFSECELLLDGMRSSEVSFSGALPPLSLASLVPSLNQPESRVHNLSQMTQPCLTHVHLLCSTIFARIRDAERVQNTPRASSDKSEKQWVGDRLSQVRRRLSASASSGELMACICSTWAARLRVAAEGSVMCA